MYYSLDTNLIFGVINPSDILRSESVRVINIYKSKKFKFIFLGKVRNESHYRFQEKLSCVIVQLLKWQNNLIKHWDNDTALKSFLTDKINELQRTNPYLKNFYTYLQARVIEFKAKNGNPRNLFSYLSELSSEIPTIIEQEIASRCEIKDLSILTASEKKRSRELKFECLSEIRFKDSWDEKIFYEAIFLPPKYQPCDFVSDDDEFMKKANKAKDILVSQNKYDSKIYFYHTTDVN